MRITPLPPLNSLVAFEAAARHLSFTKASADLHVTQGAISRQVRHLEDYLGLQLFVRDKRALYLTAAGAEYFEYIQKSLLQISSATANMLQVKDDKQITIITSNAMASFWLLPRIPEFQKLHPEIDLRILSVDSMKGLRESEFDVALFYFNQAPSEFDATPLFSETVYPVCSKAYQQQHPTISQAQDLRQGTLLSLDVDEGWVGWPEWFRESNVTYQAQDYRCLKFNSYPLLIQAALNGHGLALAWEYLVDDYIASGLLVRPLEQKLATHSQFYMLQPHATFHAKKEVQHFKEWLLSIVP
jgi:DNA-binding transcriptional LysR family regulator